jgi:hypothetical protein
MQSLPAPGLYSSKVASEDARWITGETIIISWGMTVEEWGERNGESEPLTGQRSNQLIYVPNLFSYLYRKPAYLVAFLRFNRFAWVACFNLIEPNSELNGHHGH